MLGKWLEGGRGVSRDHWMDIYMVHIWSIDMVQSDFTDCVQKPIFIGFSAPQEGVVEPGGIEPPSISPTLQDLRT